MSIEINIKKNLGKFQLDMGFATEKSTLGILGPSGSGKSMTLKCIAGIITPDQGRIVVNGRVLFDSEKRINVKPQKRRIGYLFQDYALFSTFTAYDNIGSGLGRMPAAQKRQIIEGLIERFHLQGLEKHYPHQLSGGQQQRVALARIVACEPEIILLDEPFSALDSHLRLQMQVEIKEILEGYDNAIMVTHNRDEAYKLCSDLMIIEAGIAAEQGKTEEIFASPRTVQAARLIGCKNISPIKRLGEQEFSALEWGGQILRVNRPLPEGFSHVGIHAHELRPIFTQKGSMDNVMPIRVKDETETRFEKQLLVLKADQQALEPQTGLFWEYSKGSVSAVPEFLELPAQSLLLLED